MAKEAELKPADGGGVVPDGDGWFVLNARDAQWWHHDTFGSSVIFEGEARFPQFGMNIQVLEPGQPNCMYHGENAQEGFLVLSGECLLLVNGEERPLRQWDFVHFPPNAGHTIIGAGEGPCVVVAVGARGESTGPNWGAYTVHETAIKHGAGVEQETNDPNEAYARFPRRGPTRYQRGWLP